MRYTDGSVFIGTWSNDERCGHGQLTLDGRQNNGAWLDDHMHGEGELVQDDGVSYIGEFKYGTMDGKGRLMTKDGSYFDGYWWNGEISGAGFRFNASTGKTRRESWYKGKLVKVLKQVKFK